MGSPLSPVAADMVMEDLEKKCIDSLPFQVPFYFRYVDDILTAVPINEIDTIKKTFNSYNHHGPAVFLIFIVFVYFEDSEPKNLFCKLKYTQIK